MSPNAQITLTKDQRYSLFRDTIQRSDKIIQYFLFGSFGFGFVLAPFYETWLVAFLVGGLVLAAYFLAKITLPESSLYQYVASACFAIFMAQFIYQMHGLFEMHFYAFVCCTIMITYSNWRLQLPLLVIIVAHHATLGYLQFAGMEGVYFTQLPYMDVTTFLFHISMAGIIIFICGMWGYYSEKKIIKDGLVAIQMKLLLKKNIALAEEIKNGNLETGYEVDEKDILGHSLVDMRSHLLAATKKEQSEKFINTGINQIGEIITNEYKQDLSSLAKKLISYLAQYIGAHQGTFFIVRQSSKQKPYLQLYGGYAFQHRKGLKNKVKFGEGLIGQVAIEKSPITIQQVPEDYLVISSSLGSSAPTSVIAIPLMTDRGVKGVIELATFGALTEDQTSFLNEVSGLIATTLENIEARTQTEQLLKESKKLQENLAGANEELILQKEGIQESNRLLEEQTQQLRDSESELRKQQDQLLEVNDKLELQATLLEEQKTDLELKNEEVERASETLEFKAEELERTGKYKSEFLANMSHELRTPLNSILILANMLKQNRADNLSEKEVQHAKVIHKAGSDLLTLINDILDLSKIESGKLDLISEAVHLEEVSQDLELLFRQVAETKSIDFKIDIDSKLPQSFTSDRVRLEQILKNLLSNAFKFTSEKGLVSLEMIAIPDNRKFQSPLLADGAEGLGFLVKDNGIGIPEEKQALIFEAFNQADGSTSRRFGGTGLGLSICLKLAELLGGEVQLESKDGEGSCFSLWLPFQGLAGSSAEEFVDMEKVNSNYTFKQKDGKYKVLIVEDQVAQNNAINELLLSHEFETIQAFTGKETKELLKQRSEVDCIILDMHLPDTTGLLLLKEIKSLSLYQQTPVIINTALDLDQEIQEKILKYTHSFITKTAKSDQRLINEINLLLDPNTETNEVEITQEAPVKIDSSQKRPTTPSNIDSAQFESTSVLIVDDDMRNLFALSAVLEECGFSIIIANNGKEALEKLEEESAIELVLMDIMMPVMDGYEAMETIRKNDDWIDLPIIALTAKARKSDRDACIAAGANEYLSKPIDTEKLIEVMATLLNESKSKTSIEINQ